MERLGFYVMAENLEKGKIEPGDAAVCVEKLLCFAKNRGLLHPDDMIYARNALFYALQIDEPGKGGSLAVQPSPCDTAIPCLRFLCGYAVQQGIVQVSLFHQEQFMAHLMNLLTPPPSRIIEQFEIIKNANGCEAATDWFYALCRSNDSIRVDEIARNTVFWEDSPYGKLEITINLSKPEKDPHEIAMLRDMPESGYPACMLCLENEGFAGRPSYPSHETLRTIPVKPRGENWRFQFSPYAYYEEHCIALNERHIPMRVDRRTFSLLLSFVGMFPHYFFGSNADLPIVGGSILNHDHFQGGRHVFPMDRAEAYASFAHPSFQDVSAGLIRWPMTCVRLISKDAEKLIEAAETIREAWHSYNDPARGILSQTNDIPHNTVTPIARRLEDGRYLLHLVLRNNRTTPEYPLGLFHPHAELHHIKRENIGLIEVMGLFILPGRLQEELSGLEELLAGKRMLGHIHPDDALAKHARWVGDLMKTYGTVHSDEEARAIIRQELATKCAGVLEDAGVYKLTGEGMEGAKGFLRVAGFMGNAYRAETPADNSTAQS